MALQHTPPPTLRHSQRWLFLAILSLGLFMVGVDNSILYTALPTLEAQLNTTELQGLWTINAYPLVVSALLLGTGTLGDKIGHRRMFDIGLLIFGIASAIAAFSPNPATLITARGLLGIGAATLMPATLALLRHTFTDVRERNIAIGIWGSVATLGAAIGPLIGGLLLEHFWWGSVFLINVPVVIFTLIATFALGPANEPNQSKQWDFLSSFYAMIAMAGLVIIIKEFAHAPTNYLVLGCALVAALIAGWLFQRRQATLAQPTLSWDIFNNRLLQAGVSGAGFGMFVLAGTELLTTQRMQITQHFSPLEAGLLVASGALAAFPTSVLGGAILHRVGFTPLIAGGFFVMSAGTGLIAFGPATLSTIIAGLVLTGAGAGLVMSVTSTAIIGSAPASRSGMASSVEAVSYEFGTLLSVAILGSLSPWFYNRYLNTQPSAPAYDAAYFSTITIAALAALSAAILTVIIIKGNPKETEYAHE
ncbi:MAG: MFS transporter [Corynebacterium sp.]|uniref:MFS transporter n=1 Tax=Corynebacterium sp. TaxID=1720 RepID=UPI0026DC92A1|nr:MFS transporter [Corynebacterium sp.]MDO4761035.1 MFS transporter [Corynebacterium sp.]